MKQHSYTGVDASKELMNPVEALRVMVEPQLTVVVNVTGTEEDGEIEYGLESSRLNLNIS